MNIKTFRAESLQEGLRRVHEELGEDARIMHTREVEEKRLFGLRRRRCVEITAAEATDEEKPSREEAGPESRPEKSAPSQRPGDPFLRQLQSSPYEEMLAPPPPQRLRTEAAAGPGFQPAPFGLWRRMSSDQLNPTVLQRSLIALFEEIVSFGGPIDLSGGKRKTVALLGPTGVGKTATLAKIAAHYRLKEFKRVGFVTTDTFRVAAAEQLQKYAEMFDCPMETVPEPFRMKSALQRLADCDLVLLDTPGTNPKNAAKLRMLAAMLDAAPVDEVHLLLPAVSGAAVLVESLRRFEALVPTGLTITKLDEAVGLADLYQLLKVNRLPLRFLTMGQNVTEDIEAAGPVRLASLAH